MKRIFLLCLCLAVPQGLAQRDLINVFQDFNDQLEQWCPVVGNFDLGDANSAITWVCSVRPTIGRATRMVDELLTDTNGFFTSAIRDGVGLITDATGWEVGGVDIGTLVVDATNDIYDSIQDGSFLPSSVLGKILARTNAATIQNLTAPPDADASELERDIVSAAQHDPGRLASELTAIGARSETVMQSARSQDIASVSRELAATSLARGDEEQLLKRVTSPDPLTEGTADRAERLSFASVSTRAVAQQNTKMLTDLARQLAVSSANVTTAVKEQMLQQSLTTQQIANLAQQIASQQMEEFNAWQKDYYNQLALDTVYVNNLRDNYTALAEFLEP
jgi:hypothetical protein